MANDIFCPYCKKKMRLLSLGANKNKMFFYECEGCLSRSPLTWNAVTARSMAKMRNGVSEVFVGENVSRIADTHPDLFERS